MFNSQNPYKGKICFKKELSRGMHNEWELFYVYFADYAMHVCFVYIYTRAREYRIQANYIRLALVQCILHTIKYVLVDL